MKKVHPLRKKSPIVKRAAPATAFCFSKEFGTVKEAEDFAQKLVNAGKKHFLLRPSSEYLTQTVVTDFSDNTVAVAIDGTDAAERAKSSFDIYLYPGLFLCNLIIDEPHLYHNKLSVIMGPKKNPDQPR
jgi:hypothetical protein